jgi:tetratricopeptide (TPR) repeat protein
VLLLSASSSAAAAELDLPAGFDTPGRAPEMTTDAPADEDGLRPEDIDFLRRLRAKLAATGRGDPGEIDRLAAIIRKCREVVATARVRTASSGAPLRQRLEEILLAAVADDRGDRRAKESLALYYLFLERPEEAVRLYLDLGPASPQDIFHPLLTAYAYLRLGAYADAGRYLDRLAPLMRERRPLRVAPPVLCSDVTAYRLYEPLRDETLRPGGTAWLYIELDGVAFRPTGTGRSACSLRFGLEVRDALQNRLWERPDYARWVPEYQGPVRDMHAVVLFRVPADLPAGRYSVFVHCRDLNSGQSGTGDAAFSVGGASLAPQEEPRAGGGGAAPEARTERPSIEEERRRLEEEKKRLEEERSRLEEERRREIDDFLRRHLDSDPETAPEELRTPLPSW